MLQSIPRRCFHRQIGLGQMWCGSRVWDEWSIMLRFYTRLMVILLVLFATVPILAHAQPYDDHDLRKLLLPEGCPAPCFMGIRPGVTTTDEAVKLLEKSGWAEHIESVLYGTQ